MNTCVCCGAVIPEGRQLCLACSLECDLTNVSAIRVTEVKEENGGVTVVGTIKDSGDRTEFETGAVRDMREGKGRCDLMPLEVVGEWLKDDILPYDNWVHPLEFNEVMWYNDCDK